MNVHHDWLASGGTQRSRVHVQEQAVFVSNQCGAIERIELRADMAKVCAVTNSCGSCDWDGRQETQASDRRARVRNATEGDGRVIVENCAEWGAAQATDAGAHDKIIVEGRNGAGVDEQQQGCEANRTHVVRDRKMVGKCMPEDTQIGHLRLSGAYKVEQVERNYIEQVGSIFAHMFKTDRF